jgi:hypothetical protein
MCYFHLQVQALLLDSLILKMDKLRFFETLENIYQPAWHNVSEDMNLQLHHLENLKFRVFDLSFP